MSLRALTGVTQQYDLGKMAGLAIWPIIFNEALASNN
jgi:hypothetical protein